MQISKYSASGNDFVIFHSFVKKDRSTLAKKLCDRNEGVGADGMIVLVPHAEFDFEWEFYNADGSYASMCGNGARAAAHYAFSNGLVLASTMNFVTGAGVIEAQIQNDIVQTQLTKPQILRENFEEDGFVWSLIDTGVPHLVAVVENLERFDCELFRKLRFKHNANVNIVKIEDGKLFVRTYERGVENETKACGTGMAACFFRLMSDKVIGEKISVYPSSGEELQLLFSEHNLFFKGKVKKVFDTILELSFL